MTSNRQARRRAAALTPKAPEALFKAAVAHHQAGDLLQAESAYRAMLRLDRGHAMVWSNLAAILMATGRCTEAIAACGEALAITPDHLNAQINLATAQQKQGDVAAAIETFESVIARHPKRCDVRKSLGSALESIGRVADAIAVYNEMLAIDPEDPDAWTAKAEALRKLERNEDAIVCFAEVVRLRPDDASALSSLGILKALHSLDNDLDVAANLCLRAATLMPNHAPIVNNLGVVLQIRGETDNALLVLRQLTQDHPTFASAHSNIGSVLSAKGRYDEAEDAFLTALSLDPTSSPPQIELTKVRRHLCDWRFYEADTQTIHRLIGDGTNFMIVLMASSTSAEEQLVYARGAMAKYNARTVPRGSVVPADPLRRLRIGYISADFRDHPVGRLVPDVIALHDRARFEIFGYSLGAGEMVPLRARLALAFDHFIDLDKVSDAEAAARIRDDGIDILVDLTGPTAGSRFDILAQRPAPVQVSFLGLPGTLGADCMDYIIADRLLVPSGHERFYHEQVVRLPHCYQPGDTARQLLSPLPSRADCGLPETGFVFCSFNSPVKITPEVFDTWMRLLHAVDGSVLWLYCKAEKAKRNLLARAIEQGIDADRIVFAGAGPFEIYLTRMTCADLFLDTFPYAAGATCNDALWVGLPVLTRVGETYVSRMAGSLLATLGLPELITETLEAYEATALRLATDPEALNRLKERLHAARDESPLFDMRRFTAALETAYSTMAAASADGVAPATFDVAE